MDYPLLEDDYDVAAPEIKCHAGKVGAKIFLVPAMNAFEDDVRVLAFDRKTAVYWGRNYSIERDAARYMDAPLFGVKAVED